MKSKCVRRMEKGRRRRHRTSAAAVAILYTVSLPQHFTIVLASAISALGREQDEINSNHERRKLTEQRRRMEERRRLLEEHWSAEAIRNLQTLDYVLDESDSSNIPRYFIRSRDGMLISPLDDQFDEDILDLEEVEGDDVDGGSSDVTSSNTEGEHHQKSRFGPTNADHHHIWNQFEHWQSGERNLRGIIHEDDVDTTQVIYDHFGVIDIVYDEDDPEELEEYDLVYIGNRDESNLHHNQRELSLADKFVSGSSANDFVNGSKEDPKGKGKNKPPPKGKGGDQELLPFGKKAKIFNQIFPSSGSVIGTVQAFGAQVNDGSDIKDVSIQFKDHKNKRSKWKSLPESKYLHDWFMKEIKGFPENKQWLYRMKAKNKSKDKEITAWMELAINIERQETPSPTLHPTPNPTPAPSPKPSSPPSPQPSPEPTHKPTTPPSPLPTQEPTTPPSPLPTPWPTYASYKWTKHPTRYPTTDSPTVRPSSPPSNKPSSPPTNKPTSPPSNNPTNRPTKSPSPRPSPQPSSPPTAKEAEAVQQAPPQILSKSVRDEPWEHGGKIQYSSGRILFFFDGNPYVCTGTVVDDGDHPDRTLILTAGHCAFKYDRHRGGRFADYALFIPNQDETRGRGSDETCSNDPLGCWTLAFALVDYEWSTRTFPSSVPWDYAIYVISNVPESHQPGFIYKSQPELSSVLEEVVTRFPIDFTYDQKTAATTHTHGLGYTFSKDPDFRYCAKDLTTKFGIDSYENLWLSVCDMAGGSSGGPWMKDTKDDGSGTIISINSWGYSSSTGMAGPNFYTEGGSRVECLFEKAKVIDFDDVKDGGVIVSDC